MQDDKRRLRQWKRDVKKQGNRRRRRFFKDVTKSTEDFDFGADSSRSLNGQDRRQSDDVDE